MGDEEVLIDAVWKGSAPIQNALPTRWGAAAAASLSHHPGLSAIIETPEAPPWGPQQRSCLNNIKGHPIVFAPESYDGCLCRARPLRLHDL
jgi:hypothetical protein